MDRLDALLSKVLDQENASASLKTFVCQLLILFHGNTAVERSFSINKECHAENLLNNSLIAQRVIYDAVAAAGGIAAVQVPKGLIHAVRNVSTKLVEAAKKKDDAEAAAASNRKCTVEEIKHLEAKKVKILQVSIQEGDALNDEL